MKKMMIAWGFLVIGLVSVLTFIGFSYKNNNKKFYEIEKDIKETANAYVSVSKIDLSPNESLKVKIEELINLKILDNPKIEENECVGYVTIKRNSNKKYIFSPFIKCNDYQTNGYEE